MTTTIKMSDEFHSYLKKQLEGTRKTFEGFLREMINKEEDIKNQPKQIQEENNEHNNIEPIV